jgi:UDP-2,3-diacylglucosamine pyrophosphatase LpxH
VKSAVNFIGSFEETLSGEARRRQVDGVVCGHIHTAAMHDKFGLQYINTGDWVESCTAVVEHHDGRLELIKWRRMPIKAAVETPADREAQAAA